MIQLRFNTIYINLFTWAIQFFDGNFTNNKHLMKIIHLSKHCCTFVFSSELFVFSWMQKVKVVLYRKWHLLLFILTISLFLVISNPMTLLKKLANRGFKGFSISKKAYNFFTSSSLSARASLICDTSDVRSSQAVFEYL